MVSAAKNMETRSQGLGLFFLIVWGRNGMTHLLNPIQVFPVTMSELNHELDHYALRGECEHVNFPYLFAGERDSMNPKKFWLINGKCRVHLPCPRVDATL